MCTYVNGSGLTVNYAQVSVSYTTIQQICNYQAMFTVYNSAGTRIWTASSRYYSGCVVSYTASRTIGVGATFPNNSRGCGSWFQSGTRLGTACLGIHS